MRAPAWKRLVDQLTDEGYESPYLDRLRRRLGVYQAQRELEKEILQEMAAALGRAEEKVLVALLELELLGRQVDRLEAEGAEDLAEAVLRFNAKRREARQRLWELVIHREALGFRNHRILDEFYPIPPPRRPRA
ncbi:hypothetical protein [Deferrisoma sp.]